MTNLPSTFTLESSWNHSDSQPYSNDQGERVWLNGYLDQLYWLMTWWGYYGNANEYVVALRSVLCMSGMTYLVL